MSDWDMKDDGNGEYFPIPSKPVNPLTPDRLKKLKDEAEARLLALYNTRMNPSGSMDTSKKEL